MRAKMEQYKVDVRVDGSTTEAKQLARLDVEGRNGFTNKKISIGSAIKIR